MHHRALIEQHTICLKAFRYTNGLHIWRKYLGQAGFDILMDLTNGNQI